MSKEKQIEVITYEQDRLYFFVDQVSLAQKKYDRLFKTFKDAPYLSEGAQFLSDAGRELQFYKDVVEMLDKGYRKQIEGELVKVITDDRVHWKCSACGKDTDLPNYEKADYCFNCGAHMRKEDEGKMNKRPLDKTKKSNIKCEHCKHFAESSETRWGVPIMKCECQDSIWHNEERFYWNRCKCFEWHERYDHPTEKGGE